MAIRTSTAFANLQLGCASTSTNGSLSGVFNHSVIALYSGAQPASADNAPTGSLLGLITLSGGAFTAGTTTNGLVFGEPTGWVASGRTLGIPAGANWSCFTSGIGTIGWARLLTNTSDPITTAVNDTTYIYPRIDFAVGTTTGDIQLSNVNVTGTAGSNYQGTGTNISVSLVQLSI